MSVSSPFTKLGGIGCLGLIYALMGCASLDIVGHGINDFPQETDCKDGTLRQSYNYLNILKHYAQPAWGYDNYYYWTDTRVDPHDFADRNTIPSWGRDSVCPDAPDDHSCKNGTDWADVVFLATHGRTPCKDIPWDASGNWSVAQCKDSYSTDAYVCDANEARSEFTMGDPTPDISGYTMSDLNRCRIDTRDHIRFGYGADVFMTTACSSIDPCTWAFGGYDAMHHSQGGFNTYLGFYGRHNWVGPGGNPDLSKTELADIDLTHYVNSTRDDGLGLEWLLQMHTGVSQINCPMALVWAKDSAAAWQQFRWGGYRDFRNTKPYDISALFFLGGCDPNGTTDTTRPALPSAPVGQP